MMMLAEKLEKVLISDAITKEASRAIEFQSRYEKFLRFGEVETHGSVLMPPECMLRPMNLQNQRAEYTINLHH